ncbi:MAG: hypothetical protein ACI8QZ_001886 [Chlamydiales bacterium]
MSHQGKLRNAIGFVLLAVACSWPYFETLRYWPMTGDPALWIGRGTGVDPEWYRWVFLGDHFSWYRPLAALSFTFDHALGGLNPLVYRMTDLGLHVLAGYLVLFLGRALAPGHPTWIAYLAAAIFLAHPGSEEIVPYMARRSYSLGTVFGLAALCLVTPRAGRARLFGAGTLLAAALLSNEAAVVITPIALCMLWRAAATGTAERSRLLADSALVVMPVVAALALRALVLGGLGGYGDEVGQQAGLSASLMSMWTTLTGLDWLAAIDVPDGTHSGAALMSLFALYFVVRVAASTRATQDGSWTATPVVLSLWLTGYAALILWSGLWVERQIYFLQAPFAWLVALLIAGNLGARHGRPVATVAKLAPLLIILASLLDASPVLRGQREGRMQGWRERQGLLAQIDEDLSALEGPACVHTVLPNMRRRFRTQSRAGQEFVHQSMRHPLVWSQVLVSQSDITVSDWVYFDRAHGVPTLQSRAEGDAQDGLLIPPGADYLVRRSPTDPSPLEWIVWTPGFELRDNNSTRLLPYHGLPLPAGQTCYVYMASPTGGQLLQISE